MFNLCDVGTNYIIRMVRFIMFAGFNRSTLR